MDEDLRPATSSRPGMAKHSATPQTLPQGKISPWGTGPSSGIRCVPKGEVNAPGKTLKLCLEWPTVQVTKNGRVANGVALPKDPWVSVHKLGADGGACSELIRNPGLPFCVFTIWARDYLKHDQMRTLLPQGIAVPDQLARGPALRTKPVFVVNALG